MSPDRRYYNCIMRRKNRYRTLPNLPRYFHLFQGIKYCPHRYYCTPPELVLPVLVAYWTQVMLSMFHFLSIYNPAYVWVNVGNSTKIVTHRTPFQNVCYRTKKTINHERIIAKTICPAYAVLYSLGQVSVAVVRHIRQQYLVPKLSTLSPECTCFSRKVCQDQIS